MTELHLDLLPDDLKRQGRPNWVRTAAVALLVAFAMLVAAGVALREIDHRAARGEARYLRAELSLYGPRAAAARRLEALLASVARERRAGVTVTAAGRLERAAAAHAPAGVSIADWQYGKGQLQITVSAPTMQSAVAFVLALYRRHVVGSPHVVSTTGSGPVQVVVAGKAGTP